ncbi:unnamed protein product [Lathyrus oleraceus]
MYTKVKKYHKNGVHSPVTVDVATDRAYGEHVEDFMGYIELQGRSKVSILIDSWHDIDEELKNNIWTNVLEVFIISLENSMVKKKLLTYTDEHWKGFKTAHQ